MSVLLQKNQVANIDLLAGLGPLELTSWSSLSDIQGTYIGVQDGNISFLTTNTLYHLKLASQVKCWRDLFCANAIRL